MEDKLSLGMGTMTVSEKAKMDHAELTAGMSKKEASRLTPELIDVINKISKDPKLGEGYREAFVSFSSVLSDGKYKMHSYIDAVKFVSFRLMDMGVVESYKRTFPVKVAGWKAALWEDKDINSQASRYNKNPLVQKILEQSQVPDHILYMDMNRSALNALLNEGLTAKSDTARVTALIGVIQATKQPEISKHQVQVEVNNNVDGIEDLRKAATELAELQQKAISDGVVSAQDVAVSGILEAEVVDDEENEQ